MKTILIILTIMMAASLHAECVLERARVAYIWDKPEKKIYKIGNLDKNFYLTLKKGSRPEFEARLEESSKDKNVFLDLFMTEGACEEIKDKKAWKNYIQSKNIVSSAYARPEYQCMECIELYNPPFMFMLPNLKEMRVLVRDILGISEAGSDTFITRLVKDLEMFDSKTPQGNSMMFPAFFLKNLYDVGVREITPEAMEGIKKLFANSLKGDEVKLLNKVLAKIKSIELTINSNGDLQGKLITPKGGIELDKNEIPVTKADQKEMLDKYFDRFIMNNGATATFTISEAKKIRLELSGLEIVGKFPVFGPIAINNIRVKPTYMEYQDDRDIPAQMQISVKKLIKVYKTFNFDF